MQKKIAVYTVLVGKYDNLQQPEYISDDFDYICFSNDIPHDHIGVWKVHKFDYTNSNRVRESRFPKLNPHLLLPDYDFSLYIDANQRITKDLLEKTQGLMHQNVACAMIVHPTRDCIYQEAHFLVGEVHGGLRVQWDVFRMVRLLVKEKYPEHNGLCCGCAIFRKHNDSHVIAFSKKWWETYSQYCQRDQMSANYALWKVNLQPEVLWGKDFYYSHQRPHIHQEGRIYKASLAKIVESYILIAFLKAYYFTHGISWSRWKNHE